MDEACGLRFKMHVFLISVPHSGCASFLGCICFVEEVTMVYS